MVDSKPFRRPESFVLANEDGRQTPANLVSGELERYRTVVGMTPQIDPSEEIGDIEEELSILLHALRASRRRCVIQCLEETKESETVSTRLLAQQIAARENGTAVEYVSGEPYKNVYNALSQTHLPTLNGADVIVYDSKRQMVQKGPLFDLAALLLNLSQPAIETFHRQ